MIEQHPRFSELEILNTCHLCVCTQDQLQALRTQIQFWAYAPLELEAPPLESEPPQALKNLSPEALLRSQPVALHNPKKPLGFLLPASGLGPFAAGRP